ncbi:MAG: metallophosphoesterase family protein [Bryobacterales bacterium]|nr:metallophosphoesterase family protein [Bryobacterales bacterium]
MKISHIRWIALGAAAVCLLAGYAVTGQKSRMVTEADIHRATPIPDRIILTWAGDPATTAAVTWRTDTTVDTAVAQIAVAEDGPGFVKKSKTVNAVTDKATDHYHSLTFTGLQPDTQYVYRVGDGANWSDWNQFQTAAAGPAPLEFIYVGDAQNDIYSLWSRLIRNGFTEAPKARFILHAGDLANRGVVDYEWGEWHAAAGWINRSIFAVPTPGNHEYPAGEDKTRKLTPYWRRQFTLPGNGVSGLEETNYWFDIQGVRIVSMNSNERQKEQGEWLDKLLTNNPNQWTILTFHHPILSTATGRDNKALREMWQPVFDKHRVDMVLTGHDHTYGRSNVASGTSGMKGGTVYVVSVSGPKMYNLEWAPWMQRAAEDTQLYQVIRVDGKQLRYEARTARGMLYDAFTLTKSKGRPNKLTNPRLPHREHFRSAEEKAALAREAAERKAAEEKKKTAK